MPFSVQKVNLENNNTSLKDTLLEWYFTAKRDLPFRAKSEAVANPYYILVSEIMLQQTTVQTVIPYFKRFIEAFPTYKDLAEAPLDKVYTLWQGLGYYSRANNLHQASKQINAMPSFPSDIETLKSLKGVGPYTSAAIASIAFNAPVIPVDGNVMRVFSRLFNLETPKGPKLEKECQYYTHHFVDTENNKYTAQAIMELGALICRPQNPKCDICPLNHSCLAYQLNKQQSLPVLTTKPIRPKYEATSFIAFNEEGKLLILKRPSKGLFANLYIFPTSYFEESPIPLPFKEEQLLSSYIKHVFTHFELSLKVIKGSISCHNSSSHLIDDNRYLWISPHELSQFPMPTLMKKVQKLIL